MDKFDVLIKGHEVAVREFRPAGQIQRRFPLDAQQEMDRATNRAEKLGLLIQEAQAHFLR